MKVYDVIIIGAGQAGLSVAYFLRRTPCDYLIIDDQKEAGGAWLHSWESLKLFSPREDSSLSGWQMPKTSGEYPTKNEFIDYLNAYHKRYDFPIQTNTLVHGVKKENGHFKIETNQGDFFTRTLVSTTGTAKNPFIPHYPNHKNFQGVQLHSVDYKEPKEFEGKKVLLIGGGNSGAQILSEVSTVALTKWVTLTKPRFLPKDIDGHDLFRQANIRYFNEKNQADYKDLSLNDIVQVNSVKEGLNRNIYQAVRPFQSFYDNGVIWRNGEKEPFDAVIWCTGFQPNLQHLQTLNIMNKNRIETVGTRSLKEPQLWLVGYGNWTGFASATIYGVGKTARATAKEISVYLEENSSL